MQYSIVIPSRSEGRLLQATVDSITEASAAADYEIVVIDDASDDYSGVDLADAYSDDKRVKVITNPRNLGATASRNLGAEAAAGDVLVFLDAHTFVPDGWLEAIDAAVCEHDDNPYLHTIYTCVLGQIYAEGEVPELESWNFQSNFERADLEQSIDDVGRQTDNPYPLQLCEGAVMIMGAKRFHHIGGFDAGLKPPWGQECHELSFRNWMLGGENRIIPSIMIRTLYRAQFPYAGIHWENITFNKLRLAYTLFSDDRFERVALALLRREDGLMPSNAKAMRMLMASDTHARREALRKRFTRTDDEVIGMFTNQRW